jgi:hypothetical protein
MTLREALRLPWDLMRVLVQCCREQCTVALEFGFSNIAPPAIRWIAAPQRHQCQSALAVRGRRRSGAS